MEIASARGGPTAPRFSPPLSRLVDQSIGGIRRKVYYDKLLTISMVRETTSSWAVECTDECGLSRTGHYACALGSFLVAIALASIGITTLFVLLSVPELLASFALVFGFFALWAGTWLTTEAVWNRWIAHNLR